MRNRDSQGTPPAPMRAGGTGAWSWSVHWALPPQATPRGWFKGTGSPRSAGVPRPGTAAPTPRGGLDRRRLQRVLDYVENRLDSELGLAELSAVACLSKFHFARAFKAATGVSPQRHVGARRLERAKARLREGMRPLADIALECRFSSQANFSRAFRQAVGMTPGQYRASRGATVRRSGA